VAIVDGAYGAPMGQLDPSQSSPLREPPQSVGSPSVAAATPSAFDSMLLEGRRLARETAGDISALANLISSLPRQLKDSVVHAVHELYGNQVAVEAVGQQRTDATQPKQSEAMAATAPMDDLQRVMAYAGHQVTDRGGFVYMVGADGSFEIVHAPGASQKAMGRRITAAGVYGKAWLTLASLVPVVGPGRPAATNTATATPSPAPQHLVHDAPTDLASGVAHFKTKAPTVAGDTLDIAQTRADRGLAGTTYSLSGMTKPEQAAFEAEVAADKNKLKEGKLSPEERGEVTADIAQHTTDRTRINTDYAADLASGRDNQDMFYCSGLSIWTMAAAGYDVNAQLVGSDGQPYFGEEFADVMVDANGKRVYQKKNAVGTARIGINKKYVTLKKLIDGDPVAIEIITRAQGRTTGGSVGEIMGTGYQTEHAGEGLPLAAHGAAGAFEFAGIGSEVSELEQKPGDFAQSRRTTTADGRDTGADVKHRGFGHAWQVLETHVVGEALFGQPGSPTPKAGKLEGWHSDVAFTITNDTDPSKVGKHVITHARRIEAQSRDAVANKGADSNDDGGVQRTGALPVPDQGLARYTGYVAYFGRLSQSRWFGWQPATAPKN